ncbi:acyltransferase family protein [Granulicella sibirica]|uniref:Acyltransferase n=1 Tax=Granulicella sibirica TaxID=2479048 RepID=A0A4Q0T710_9BACT|nr:acyltransferase [Granulicella sibirica]RXH58460.1 Acyltransferase [Granulicella sibirica]
MELSQVTDARSPAYTPGVSRLPNLKALTSIRFFAALYVALYHLVRPFSLWGIFAGFMASGYVGVSFFFMLSGFILTYSHAREYESGKGNAVKFWVARFARVYPVYLISMLFAAYVNRSQFHMKIHILAYVTDLLMVQSWSIRTAAFFNVPAWSLSCEAFFYLAFPYLILRLRPSTATKSILSVAGFWLLGLAAPLVCIVLFPDASWQEFEGSIAPGARYVYMVRKLPLLAIPEFFAGVSLGWFYLRFGVGKSKSALFAVTGAIGTLAVLLFGTHLPLIFLHNGLLIPLFALLILGLCEPNWFTSLLSVPFLMLLGEASFSLYLIHFLFNDWMKNAFGVGETIPSALWKLVIVIGISIGLHLGVERPGRRLVLEWWRARHPDQMALAGAPLARQKT